MQEAHAASPADSLDYTRLFPGRSLAYLFRIVEPDNRRLFAPQRQLIAAHLDIQRTAKGGDTQDLHVRPHRQAHLKQPQPSLRSP